MTYRHVTGSQENRPLEVDSASSSTVTYIRKNIERVTHEDSMTGEETEMWEYDEAEVPKGESAIVIAGIANAKADYIAMMSDIDLEV